MSKASGFAYRPDGKVLLEFFVDRSPVSIIQGPVGSGTSTACCHKMWAISCEQKPDNRGVRQSRWIIVRNTYEELHGTTLKTWKFWFEEVALGAFGSVRTTNPPEHNIQCPLNDGTTVDAEFIFLALDREDHLTKLDSRETTGVWINEIQHIEKAVFNKAFTRAFQGRYPPPAIGPGPTWKGLIADLNAPAEGHFIPYYRKDVPPPLEWDDATRREYEPGKEWRFFVQPPGLIEVFKNGALSHYVENTREDRVALGLSDVENFSENRKWVKESYLKLIEGQSKSYIDTYVMNRVGLYRKGKPVFESFVPETHISKERIQYRPEWPLIVGLDFARNPAAVMCQLIRGQMYVLDEFGMENVSAGTFAPLLKQRLAKNFPEAMSAEGAGIQFWGDPTGGSKGQGTDNTPYQIFRSNGMSVVAAPGNNSITLRLAAVEALLSKMIDGSPALLLDPMLRTLKAGMAGAYHFAKIQGQAGRHHDVPYKDRFSDYCDALQYACLGAGLGTAALTGGGGIPKPHKVEKKRYSLKRGRR